MANTRSSQSLERGIAVLNLIDKSPTPLGIREIARQLGFGPTIVQRLVNTLLHANYLEQNAETRRYSIGYRALGLGSYLSHRDNLIVAAQAVLQELAVRHELNGYLCILRGDRAIYLLSIQSEGPIAIRGVPGESAYLHSTAMGKVLLAMLDDAKALALVGPGPLPRVTPATITDPQQLLAELADVRRNGYASVTEENLLGVVSVGAPVRNALGQTCAAISVAFAQRSVPHLTIPDVARIVVDAAARISRNLGFLYEPSPRPVGNGSTSNSRPRQTLGGG